MNILQISPHYSPNIGGVETHLNDLVSVLTKKRNNTFVLTYNPLETKSDWLIFEKRRRLEILRLPWPKGLFYKLVPYPVLEFIYLSLGLFIISPLVILIRQPKVIHGHGLVAGFVGVFWGKVFKRRVVVSTHNIYQFPQKGLYQFIAKIILSNADVIMSLSRQGVEELKFLGVPESKLKRFTYWVDLNKFKPLKRARTTLGLGNRFIVLFVGRLIKEKGVEELIKSIKLLNKKITLIIIGTGPTENKVTEASLKHRNILFMGKISQDELPLYYAAADLLVVPSTSEEGFGRVVIESLACGTPVIGSRRGGITEALDNSVGILIDISPKTIADSINKLFKNPIKLKNLKNNSRRFALRNYSEKNSAEIINSYFTK